ncbi:Cas10/Cmr2 second palm domain-containing protein [Defluviitalea phaphyphila]|uniref:Cas10/Cmr2 second palm domain-containing protein n=1 Tax=Defluviitalea phaphyphila TaxID=1473580 RepID=UPI000730D9CE|nr:hypothetical protein [Defluviitalea phaphyphila]
MENMMCLYPKTMDIAEFNQGYNEIKSHINNEKIEILEKYKDYPYIFKDNNGKNVKTQASIYDVVRLYVALDYIISGKENKKFDRIKSYKQFFTEEKTKLKSFIHAYLKGEKEEDFKEIEIDLVKGSIYKIKKYFLENDKIKDIRGGSVLIDYLNIQVTDNIIQNHLIDECKIYSGGGNIVLITPKDKGEHICEILENRYFEIALTVQNAFEFIPTNINTFLYDFNEISRELTIKLEERKKSKIYQINPDSEVEITINNKTIHFSKDEKVQSNEICPLCQVRDGKYIINTAEGEIVACPSCFRKNKAGKDKSRFMQEYQNITGGEVKKSIKVIEDLKDKNNNIAVIYGDGNNMGNVVKNIDTPFKMAYFSRKTDEITKSCVYNAIKKNMQGKARFEVIALGGDDIFIIVPADYSLEISRDIVTEFDKKFNYEITMSVGICIGKFNTPIRNMFSIAQKKLKSAKQYVKSKKLNKGSIDIEVLKGVGLIDWNNKRKSFFPASAEEVSRFISILKEMKNNSKIKPSQIYKFRYAAEKMEKEEFKLFYLYQQSRIGNEYSKYMKKLYNFKDINELLENIDDFPWKDITDLFDLIRGDFD